MLAASGSSSKKTATIKKALILDDLMNDQAAVDGVVEFYERFGDLMANQPQVDLFHARALKGSTQQQQQPPQRLNIDSSEFKLDRLAQAIRQRAQQFKGKLFHVNESNSLNTYFLPMNNDDLEKFLESPLVLSGSSLPFEAFIIPDQVLFTRTMSLGMQHSSFALDDDNNQASSNLKRVSLNLAKSLPDQLSSLLEATNEQVPSSSSSLMLSSQESSEELSRKFLATPLLLQAKHANSLTSSEILVANIPLNNGVLHLIKKAAIVTSTKVLDYLNDNDNQLSDLVNSIGSRTGTMTKVLMPTIKLDRFRELLARERQMLATFSMESNMIKTILAPSDEAFAKLRYDLRALVQGDESMIPQHWDASYRHDLLERLVKRHVILRRVITSDQIIDPSGAQAISDNGKQLNFRIQKASTLTMNNGGNHYYLDQNQYLVECDNMEAQIIHYDLIGSDGVLHIIDRVLGEDQETVHSLLNSIVLKFTHSIDQESGSQSSIGNLNGMNQLQSELARYIESNLRRSQEVISSSTQQTSLNTIGNSYANNENQLTPLELETQRLSGTELAVISKSIGQYLDELASSNKRQMQLLSASVNISYQLARLTSMAEGLDDWNDKFKQPERMFTYFVPSDLAWLRLQQAQPELYKPLLYFLDQQQQQQQQVKQESRRLSSLDDQQPLEAHQLTNQSIVELAPLVGRSARSSESSHRLRQVSDREKCSFFIISLDFCFSLNLANSECVA